MKKIILVALPVVALLLAVAGYFYFGSGSAVPEAPSVPTAAGTSNPRVTPTAGTNALNQSAPSETSPASEATAPGSASSTETTGIQNDAFMTKEGFADEYKINIHGTALSETTVTVKKGTVVSWTNYDLDGHRLIANSGAFDSDILETGVPFFLYTDGMAPGSYTYHIVAHPEVTGTLTIQ